MELTSLPCQDEGPYDSATQRTRADLTCPLCFQITFAGPGRSWPRLLSFHQSFASNTDATSLRQPEPRHVEAASV